MGEDELRGGRWADVSAVADVLAHHGLPVSEPLLFAASGGIGAGYSLRDFTPDALTLGFRSRWQDPPEWIKSTVNRLGLDAAVHRTGSKRAAAKRFQAEIAEGPVLVLNERGQFVVVYDEQDAPDKRLLVAIRPGKIEDLPGAVRAGLADCADQLQGAPEWARWAKAMTDKRDSKGWPRVFAERRWLVGTLLTVWERVSAGGHLRGLFAEALEEASDLLELPTLGEQAEVWRGIGEQWDALAEAALPATTAEFAWVRGLIETVAAGNQAGGASEELDRLRAHYDEESPFTDEQVDALFADLGERLRAIQAAESEAVTELA